MFSIVSLGTALLAARAVSSAPTYGGSGSSGMGMSGDSSNNYGGGGYAGGNAMNTVDTSMAMASSMMAESSTAAAMMDTTSAAMMDTTSAAMMDTTSAAMMTESTMMMDTSTMMASEAMSTSSMMMDTTSAAMASMATYGSGSSSWNSGGYQDCVQRESPALIRLLTLTNILVDRMHGVLRKPNDGHLHASDCNAIVRFFFWFL